MINRKLGLETFLFIIAILVAGCDDGIAPPLSSFSLSSSSITFSSLGETVQLHLSAKTMEGTDWQTPIASWTSVNPEIATVSESGLVTSVANGSTEIIASSGTFTARASVVVRQKPATINLSETRINFENISDTAQLYATAKDALGNILLEPVLVWASGSPSIATVSEIGLITGVSLGAVEISVSINNISATANVTISHWDEITAGYKMTCGMRTSDELYCWGNNDYGQIGDGTSERRDEPTPIATSLNWVSVTSMVDHNCGILSSKLGVCWGNNDYGQIGDGTSERRDEPTPIATNIGLNKVSGGLEHSCAILVTSEIECWGRNQFGQLGNGNRTKQSIPIAINLQQTWVDITAGSYHTCAINSSSHIYCWGLNQFGQLGDGTTVNKDSPVRISGESIWTSISAGLYHTCAINTSGDASCWGLNDQKQLGSDRNQNQWPVPDEIQIEHQLTDLSAGRSHSCGLTLSGQALCWGNNDYGQLGDSTQTQRKSPVAVHGNHIWRSIEAGIHHTCGVTTSGSGYCWGDNQDGQLGSYADLTQLTPEKVSVAKY